MLTIEVTGRLENWFYVPGTHRIIGEVYGDAKNRFEDGAIIHTSTLMLKRVDVPDLKEDDVIRTRNSSYLLGKKAELPTWLL